MATVLIVQRRMTHYRVPLFQRMRPRLQERGVSLQVAYGQPTDDEATKSDSAELDWGTKARNAYLRIGGGFVCYQHLPRGLVARSDLIVCAQENRLLLNYLLLVRRQLSSMRLALWGHGANMQAPGGRSVRESFKRWFSCRVDWWFAYTELSRQIMVASGFPPDRITCLDNTIDTTEAMRFMGRLSASDVALQRAKLGLGDGPVGVFLGSLYAGKRMDLLHDAAERIHARLPAFRLLVIGDGPLRDATASWAACRPWVRYLGALTGEEKMVCLATGDLLLNPGLVGLVVLDSFCAQLPLVTTASGTRAPEAAYLENGVNSVITPDSVSDFSEAAISLLGRPDELETLRAGCRTAAQRYTIDNMAGNFCEGIVRALGLLSSH